MHLSFTHVHSKETILFVELHHCQWRCSHLGSIFILKKLSAGQKKKRPRNYHSKTWKALARHTWKSKPISCEIWQMIWPRYGHHSGVHRMGPPDRKWMWLAKCLVVRSNGQTECLPFYRWSQGTACVAQPVRFGSRAWIVMTNGNNKTKSKMHHIFRSFCVVFK